MRSDCKREQNGLGGYGATSSKTYQDWYTPSVLHQGGEAMLEGILKGISLHQQKDRPQNIRVAQAK